MVPRMECVLIVGVPPERAWRAFTEPAELSRWHGTAKQFQPWSGGRVVFADPGYPEVTGVIEDAVWQRRLRWRIDEDASVITQAFDPAGTGTRITVRHEAAPDGDGERWQRDLPALTLSWQESLADLALYLDHGVALSRHMSPRATTQMATRDTSAGVEVVEVHPGGAADTAGLRPGDLLVRLCSVPVFRRSDVVLLCREHRPGEQVDAEVVRAGELLALRLELAAMG